MAFNDISVFNDKSSIVDIFESVVAQNSESIALIKSGKSMSYAKLNASANQLARHLLSQDVHSGDYVGICIERSFELVITILAILKVGAAYVPLDLRQPSQRLQEIVEEAGIHCVISKHDTPAAFLSNDLNIVCLEQDEGLIDQYSDVNLSVEHCQDDVAYLVYTSGSTGRPKGVTITHRGVIGLLFGVDYVKLDPSKRVLQLASFSFDAATFELWGALLHGAVSVLFPEELPILGKLSKYIVENNISTLFLTTALFNTIIDEKPNCLSKVLQVLTGGEAHSVAHMRKALELLPNTEIINVYGPTETTAFATYCSIRRSMLTPSTHSVPIGKALGNASIYVFNDEMKLVEAGEEGELYIGGAGLAIGYLNQPELTEQKFVKINVTAKRKLRLYKTGDIVRYDSHGDLHFIGRRDKQVKVNGFRLELTEIELYLNSHPNIKQSCVIVKTDKFFNKVLVAFIVCDEKVVEEGEWRSYLSDRLPSYSIPSIFHQVAEMPLTINGKLDQQKLEESIC